MKRLIIADPISGNVNGTTTGHWFPVAQNYFEILSDKFNVFVAGGPEYCKQFKSKELITLPYDNNFCHNKIVIKFKVIINCIFIFKQIRNDDIIIFQQGMLPIVYLAIFLFFYKKSQVYIINYSTESINSQLKKMLYKFALKKISGVLCPSNLIGQAYKKPFCVIPDYIYSKKNDSSNKTYNEKKFDFCFVGRIVKEKGVLETAKFLSQKKYKVLIAGQISDKNLEYQLHEICDNRQNITLITGYLSNTLYLDYLINSKYCILNYSEAYSGRSSGVVLDTIFNNVPVIGSRCKSLEFIDEYEIGKTYQNIFDFNPDDVLNESVYYKYIENIYKYKNNHIEYKNKLVNFLLNIKS